MTSINKERRVYTAQMKKWDSSFGKDYTKRNPHTAKETDVLYKKTITGLTRTAMNEEFLSGLTINNALEVGCNVGAQLLILNNMGYTDLYGIELQEAVVDYAKSNTKGRDINIVKGSALDIPFKNGFFDLVFTSTVLIHIAPGDINVVLDEIYRCSRKYIWGYEYYADKYTMIEYRGEKNLLWKADFAQLFIDRFRDLRMHKKKLFQRVDNPAQYDSMYLLEKK